jgi:hypothetical protein
VAKVRGAAALEREAARARSLVGRLNVPTYEQWLAEMDRCEADASSLPIS